MKQIYLTTRVILLIILLADHALTAGLPPAIIKSQRTVSHARPEKIPLNKLLTKLETTYGIHFNYPVKLVKNVLVRFDPADDLKGNLEESLNDILANTDLKCKQLNAKMYVIQQKTSEKQPEKQSPYAQPGANASPRTVESQAARVTVSGRVTDEKGEALPGVNILVRGTTQGTTSDAQGTYTLQVIETDAVLVFSFVGYRSVERSVKGDITFNIQLQPDQSQLNEVVITDGYFNQQKKSYTGSSVTVSGADNENKPFSTPLNALQGAIAGLNITVPSGQPGANAQVRLRGLGSTALNSNPIYVVDGMIINSGDLSWVTNLYGNSANVLSGINQNDIESITVLKDASATAIYGSRGSNGVIIITTKKGKSGRAQVRFDTEIGSTVNIPFPHAGQPLNAGQFSTLFVEGLKNNGSYSQEQINALAESYGFNSGKTTNWQDLVYRTGRQQQYNVSLQGGTENTKIFASGGYFEQQATTIGSGLKRFTGLFNIEQRVNNKISFSAGMNASNVQQLAPVGNMGSWDNPVFASRILRPFQRAYSDDGSINSSSSGNTGFVAHYNPLYILANDKHTVAQTRLLGNVTAKWNVWRDLKFSSYLSLDYNALEESLFNNPVLGDGRNTGGTAIDTYIRYFNWLTRNQLDYRFHIPGVKDFYLDAAVGYEAQRSKQFSLAGSGIGFPLTQPSLNSLSNAATPTGALGFRSNYDFNSLYSRASVNFKNRYSLTASFRRDGSSVFGANNRFGNFWSVGGAWNVDEEAFFQNQTLFSSTKLRTSYGTTGNAQGIGNYDAKPLAYYGANYATGNGQNYSSVGNPDLTWEKQKKFDIGLELGFLGDRLTFAADYYNNNIYDLIQAVSISRTTGFSSVPYANSGSMQNRGIELSVKGVPVLTDDFTWTSSFNIAFNKNKVTDVGDNHNLANGEYYYFSKGSNYHTYYTRLYAGVDPANGNALWYTDATRTQTTTDYSAASRVPYKTATPKLFGGFNNTFSFKGVSVSADLYYNFGNYIVDGWSTRFNDGAYYTFNKYQYVYDNRWTTPGQVTDVPRYIAGGGAQSNSQAFSSRFLYKGDFIRFKNLSVGYDLKNLGYLKTFPGISKLYLYGRATNLWTKTFDDRLPYDPESATVAIPQFRTYTVGINVGF